MDLEESLNRQVADEFKAIIEYDELIEKMPKEHEKHIETLRNIQRQQSIHALELTSMMMDMGYKEPKMIQQIEDFIKTKGY